MTVMSQKGRLPHVEWIELKGNGILTECAVMKQDAFGNKHFIEIPNLDSIDKNRLARMLTSRNATNFQLWDLMSQVTLNNGINALEYFHQLVKVITADGVVTSPKQGSIGVGRVNTNSVVEMTAAATGANVESVPADSAAAKQAATNAKRAATKAANKAKKEAAAAEAAAST